MRERWVPWALLAVTAALLVRVTVVLEHERGGYARGYAAAVDSVRAEQPDGGYYAVGDSFAVYYEGNPYIMLKVGGTERLRGPFLMVSAR